MTVLVLLAVTIVGLLSACTPAGTTFFYLDAHSGLIRPGIPI